jgi:hypothetical protein
LFTKNSHIIITIKIGKAITNATVAIKKSNNLFKNDLYIQISINPEAAKRIHAV